MLSIVVKYYQEDSNMDNLNTPEAIDGFEFPIYQIHWKLDSTNAYKLRPYIDLDNSNFVGYLDDLSKAEKPKNEDVLTTDMVLELLYTLTSSEQQRAQLLEFDTRITVDFKLYRQEMLGMVKLYEKFARKYASHQELQQKLFQNPSIDARQTMLAKITFDNQYIYWHLQEDDPSIIRPFMKLDNNKAGYLDNCEILNMPDKKDVLTRYQLADFLMLLLPDNQKRERIMSQLYDNLTLSQRLSQKELARISQIYHESAEKHAIKTGVINNSFKSYEA